MQNELRRLKYMITDYVQIRQHLAGAIHYFPCLWNRFVTAEDTNISLDIFLAAEYRKQFIIRTFLMNIYIRSLTNAYLPGSLIFLYVFFDPVTDDCLVLALLFSQIC